ncbi:MAG: GNAT family N-acetyltransferase [Candidatus Thorarchaeota archaeon]
MIQQEELDFEKIVEFTFDVLQSSDTTRNDDRILETVREYFQAIVKYPYIYLIAYQETEIVGWMGIYLEFPTMAMIDTWTPYIQDENEDAIADLLIKKGIEFVEKSGRVKIETFLMDLTEKTMPRYEKYRKWFERQGMVRDHEWVYMVCDLESLPEENLKLPEGYEFIPLSERTNDEVYPSYYASFITSGDQRFLEQTDQQRRASFDDFFNRSAEMVEDASLLLMYNEEIVGHQRVIPRGKGCFINGIGIHPNHRRKGLGKVLLGTSLSNAAKLGLESMILEVDVDNRIAIGLYEHLGFVKKKGSISHIWHKEKEDN